MSKPEAGEPVNAKGRFERHALNLGKLIGNLQTIEMAARLAIVKLDKASGDRVQAQLPQVKIDELVELNAFTNKDDLNQTLEKYNKWASLDCRVDRKPIVMLRDALAHGRIFGTGSMKYLRLLKFSQKANDGKVAVVLAVDMTDEWFQESLLLLTQAIAKITKALDYESREFT